MKFRKEIALLMLLATIQFPYAGYAAEEDKELSLIAAEQERSGEEEQLGEINPALTESISTAPTQETDKEIKERKKKLKQTRKEKEKANEQKLKESANQKDRQRKEEAIVIEPTKVEPPPKPVVEPKPTPEPIAEPSTPQQVNKPTPEPITKPSTPQQVNKPTPEPIAEPSTPQQVNKPTPEPITKPSTPQQVNKPTPEPITKPSTPPQTVSTVYLPDQKLVYANFTEVARAVGFIPLYMSRKSGYEITALYAGQGIAEVRYGRRWEPTVSLVIRTHKRADGEELQDISGVTGVKWRVDTTTGTTIYIAKISETQQVAAWAVGHYTFSARAENLSYAGFHSLVADELVELSTHYYLDL